MDIGKETCNFSSLSRCGISEAGFIRLLIKFSFSRATSPNAAAASSAQVDGEIGEEHGKYYNYLNIMVVLVE